MLNNEQHQQCLNRIAELRVYDKEEENNFNEMSCQLTLNFLKVCPANIEPGIFLIGNGNLRLLWQKEKQISLGIQFLPEGIMQYVILYPGMRSTKDERDIFSKHLQCYGTMDVEDDRKLSDLLKSLNVSHVWRE